MRNWEITEVKKSTVQGRDAEDLARGRGGDFGGQRGGGCARLGDSDT